MRVFNRDGGEAGKPLALGQLADRRFWVSSSGARYAFTAEDDLTVSVHSLEDSRRLFRTHHETTVSSAAWSHDGRYLATASSGGVARLWDGETGRSVGRAMRHVRAVTAMAYNRDASLLATACEDRIVRVWSLPDGNLLRSGLRHESPISLLAFRESAEGLVTVTKGGVVRCWRVDSSERSNGTEVKHERALTGLEFIGEGDDALVAIGDRGGEAVVEPGKGRFGDRGKRGGRRLGVLFEA